MGRLAIWTSDQAPDRVEVGRVAWLGAGGVRVPEGPEAEGPAGCLTILPVDPPGEGAAVLVPDSAKRPAVNRIPMGPGLHLIRHGDRLEVAGQRWWVDVSAVAEPTVFDPELHGSDLFCAATRARFKSGDQIVVCPGRQGHACGLIYLQVAWEASNACHGCGSNHSPEPWAPPKNPASSWLAELLRSSARSSAALVEGR